MRGVREMASRFSPGERRLMSFENAMRWNRIDPESLMEPPPPASSFPERQRSAERSEPHGVSRRIVSGGFGCVATCPSGAGINRKRLRKAP